MENIVEMIFDKLEKFINTDEIEFEGRLGIFDSESNNFDSNIGEEYYVSIMCMLESFEGWKSKKNVSLVDYFSGKLRLSVNNETAQRKCIEKKKLHNFTCVNETLPLDFRISISKEVPIKISSFPKDLSKLVKRCKERVIYEYNSMSFELTKIITETEESLEESYEFEVEYTGNFSLEKDLKNTIFDLIYKIIGGAFACNGIINTESKTLPLETLSIKVI